MTETIPYSKQAEEALIGAVITNPAVMIVLDVEPEDFYIHRNRWIWETLNKLNSRGIEPDFVTLSDELTSSGKLEEIGGMAYLAGLVNAVPSSMRAETYAEIIKGKARRRRALDAAKALTIAAYDETRELDDTTAGIVETLTTGIRPKSGARPVSQFVDQLYREVEERFKNPSAIWGVPTGFKDFDEATGGLHKGEVLYIGGEPGIGKSILSMQMGFNMSKAGCPGAIYSLEMRGLQVVRRAVSAQGKIETRKLKTGKLDNDDWSVFIAACEQIAEMPVYICEESNLTTSSLRADLARLKARYGIKWFVLDYLYLMGDGMGKLEPTHRTEVLSARIKNISKELELAGITVNSVTKDGMDGSAINKKNIRGSGQMIHDADLIGFLVEHTPEFGGRPDKRLRTFVFAKGREMEKPRGAFHLTKFDNYPAFGDYAPEPNAQRGR